MMDFDWKSIVGSIAPTIATALGGPLAGLGVKAIAGALGLSDGAGEKDVAAAVQNASPDQLLAIQKADQDFAIRMQELGVDLEKIAGADRADARRMQIETRSIMPAVLAFLIVFLFAAEMFLVFKGLMPADEASKTVVIKSLTLLELAFSLMLGFYYGTSASSQRKDALMARR